jgi:di/tricarboxylate transporter
MSWLEGHAYLAAWLALPVAFIVAIVQNIRGKAEQVEWRQIVFLFIFLLCLAVAFSPAFDTTARDYAKYIGFPALLCFVWRR